MKDKEGDNLPYDPEKEERAIFQMILTAIFLLMLAFVAGEILSDLGIRITKLVKNS